jgi:hypothetical protein
MIEINQREKLYIASATPGNLKGIDVGSLFSVWGLIALLLAYTARSFDVAINRLFFCLSFCEMVLSYRILKLISHL